MYKPQSSIQTHPSNPDYFLALNGRKRKLIMGDGNCFFRSISFVLNGHQRGHQQVRRQLVNFIRLNPQTFQCLVWEGSVEDHVSRMMNDGAWGTQVELAATATYFHVPLFTCTPHPQTHHYYWVRFRPFTGNLKYPVVDNVDENINTISVSHIELCNTAATHYDCVLSANNTFPTQCPQLVGTHK